MRFKSSADKSDCEDDTSQSQECNHEYSDDNIYRSKSSRGSLRSTPRNSICESLDESLHSSPRNPDYDDLTLSGMILAKLSSNDFCDLVDTGRSSEDSCFSEMSRENELSRETSTTSNYNTYIGRFPVHTMPISRTYSSTNNDNYIPERFPLHVPLSRVSSSTTPAGDNNLYGDKSNGLQRTCSTTTEGSYVPERYPIQVPLSRVYSTTQPAIESINGLQRTCSTTTEGSYVPEIYPIQVPLSRVFSSDNETNYAADRYPAHVPLSRASSSCNDNNGLSRALSTNGYVEKKAPGQYVEQEILDFVATDMAQMHFYENKVPTTGGVHKGDMKCGVYYVPY